MCSVSIFIDAGRLLLTANRDELRTRGESGVKLENYNDLKCIYPVDTESKGTWVGANNYGVVAALLNMYEKKHPGSQSRGIIIPHILKYTSLHEVHVYLTQSFKPEQFATFVLLVMDKGRIHRYAWDGKMLNVQTSILESSPWIFETSSSVNTVKIQHHRQKLFQQWQQQVKGADIDSEILNFHLLRDIEDTSSSVCMAREKTHTKSITQISINSDVGEFRYLPPNQLDSAVNTSPQVDILNTNKFNILETNSTNQQSNTISA